MKRNVVFVHVPKTGGLSIRGIFFHHNIMVITHDIRQKNYLSLEKYKLTDPDCYAFAFVRNPWDRAVSTFFYLKKGGDREEDRKDAELYLPYDDFNTFVREAFKTERIFEQLHFRPQHTWLSNGTSLLTDSIGKFENLQTDFSMYCKLSNIPNYKLPRINKTRHEDYREYYDAETWEIIRNAYKNDIELFGYNLNL